MKTEKKHVGTKARTRVRKERERHRAMFLAIIPIIVIFSAYFTYNFLNQPQNQTTNPASSQLKAAIVDQLSLTIPNQTFIETATNTLKQAGYTVDYYPGENVTVEFFRNLPRYEYRIVVLRVHSTATSTEKTQGPVTIFTSERYSSSKYVYEQINDQLVSVSFSEDERKRGITYFGIWPGFVTDCMTGRFRNTTIIMMGCQGLENTLMAKAFVEKGARVYIGWSQGVTASHTDTATSRLLRHFFIEKQTLKHAVQETFKEVGFDPTYGSLLIYYPLEAGEQTIENIKR
jgi:hypothetical protein